MFGTETTEHRNMVIPCKKVDRERQIAADGCYKITRHTTTRPPTYVMRLLLQGHMVHTMTILNGQLLHQSCYAPIKGLPNTKS